MVEFTGPNPGPTSYRRVNQLVSLSQSVYRQLKSSVTFKIENFRYLDHHFIKQTNKTSQTFHQAKSIMKLNLLLLLATLVAAATAQEAAVSLGDACNYAILTKTGISTVPDSVITGDIAVSPIAATAITGFGLVLDLGGQYSTATQFTGRAYGACYGGAAETALTAAVGAMEIAYTDAASRLTADPARINPGAAGNISGMTMTPGVYTFTVDIGIDSDVYFNGGFNDVFILQTSGSILMAASTNIRLQGGARAENIFWQVAGAAVIGAGSHMEGILLVKTEAAFFTGASLNGRILAQTKCVLQMATITQPANICPV
jgi:hypothetical protein